MNATSLPHPQTPPDGPRQVRRLRPWVLAAFAVLFATGMTWFAVVQPQREFKLRMDKLNTQGLKSTAHRFVSDRYTSCAREAFATRDECVARLMVLARVQGAEFESQAGAAVRDMGLDQPRK